MQRLIPSRRAIKAFLLWGIIPSLPFVVMGEIFEWPRHNFIFMYLVLFMAASIKIDSDALSRVLISFIFVSYVSLLSTEGVFFTAIFFGMMFREIVAALPNLLDINPFAFLPYVLVGAVFLLSALAVPVFAWKMGPMSGRDRTHVSAGILALMAINMVACSIPLFPDNMPWGKVQAAEIDFESALAKSGLMENIDFSEERRTLIVLVEALPAFKDALINDALFSRFDAPDILDRYSVVRGSVYYSGSTTWAEMRELCQTRRSYLDIGDSSFDPAKCLPNRFLEQGLETVAYHGYTREFFDRSDWYPTIGFTESVFLENLAVKGSKARCGGTIAGYCDRLIGDEIRQRLESGDGPSLYYWLTLNSHYPARRSSGFGNAIDCEGLGLPRQTCVMAEYWDEVMSNVVAIAQSPNVPPLDILLVGDHAPRAMRSIVKGKTLPNQVPFVRLSLRPEAKTSQTAARQME